MAVLIDRGVRWLAEQQNDDGGWGDTDRSYSNIATTMLTVAAFHLAGASSQHGGILEAATRYIESHGSLAALRDRYGRDKTFAVPILANCALAGLVPWSEVSPLPFELACIPQRFYRLVRMPVVSYAIPALVAVGQARYWHARPANPITRLVRAWSVRGSLKVLDRMQPASGGYLEAIPLTSFVVMSLAGIGQADHPVVQRGTGFLVSSVQADGSWPIDTNLATWNTTLAIGALAGGTGDLAECSCLDWLLGCQHTTRHPFTGAEPGGWGWSDLSGAVPDADDTAGALMALAALTSNVPNCSAEDRDRTEAAAASAIRWLVGLQNRDGGWPTFCRGWGLLPFDRSGCDLTAHVIRALIAWRPWVGRMSSLHAPHTGRIDTAIQRGFDFLERCQNPDGSWIPLWFGNQDHPNEENPVYGTARVLLAYRDAGRITGEGARRALLWLETNQNLDGGWGGVAGDPPGRSSVEETALAVESLLAASDQPSLQPAVSQGLEWLMSAVEQDIHGDASPIGFYFAKLWYYEKLYPLIFTAAALGQAFHALLPQDEPRLTTTRLSHV